MIHGSLFSGIGGFDLASEWMGWQNAFHCEWSEFGQKILKYYWPNAESYGDITKTNFAIWRNRIDVLTGGFPCQPYSQAGKRLGKEDERHLWPEMLRAVREISPRWVVGENVRGLTTWNGGLVFDEVQADLEAEGYEVLPFLLPASGVNAPHERYRIWFVAYARLFGQGGRQFEPVGLEQLRKEWNVTYAPFKNGGLSIRKEKEYTKHRINGNDGLNTDTTSDRWKWERQEIEIKKGLQQESESAGKLAGRFEGLCSNEYAADTEYKGLPVTKKSEQSQSIFNAERNNIQDATNSISKGLQGNQRVRPYGEWNRKETFGSIAEQVEIQTWNRWPTESPICSRNDGLSLKLDGITFPKWRNESIKAYGNAIVPQVVYNIFKAINEYEKTT